MRKALCLGVPLLLALTLLLSSAFGGERPGRGGRGGRVKRGSKGGTDTSPAVGAEAPDFDLVKVTAFLEKTKGGQVPEKWAEADKVKLSSFRNKKPVVFALSSYT